MAADNGNTTCVPFNDAIKVVKLDTHTYRIHLIDEFSVGAGMVKFSQAPARRVDRQSLSRWQVC